MFIQFTEEEILKAKEDFQKAHGTNDEFKLITSMKDRRVEVNGATGAIKTTFINEKQEVVEVIETNLFEILEDGLVKKSVNEEPEEFRLTHVNLGTKGPDPFHILVKSGGSYSSDYKITIKSWYYSKTYYKNGSWNTGATNGYYNCVKNANRLFDVAAAVCGGTILKKLLGYFGAGKLPSVDDIIAALAVLGINIAGGSIVAFAGSVAGYFVEINRCQYFYNQI